MLKPLQTIVGVVGTGVLLVACGEAGGPIGPSMTPIGDGLRFLGICAVVAVLVAVLGLSRRGGGPHG
jgi:hypothetical protein